MQMSSAAGKVPAPGQAVYSASKFALNGYFHSLRSEVYTNIFCCRQLYCLNGFLQCKILLENC